MKAGKSKSKTQSDNRSSKNDLTKQVIRRAKAKVIPIRQAVYCVLAFGFVAATITLFPVEPELAKPLFARPYNYYRLAIIVLALVFLLLATKSTWSKTLYSSEPSPKANLWLMRLGVILPAVATIFLVIQLSMPQLATMLVRKESWPFFRNAIFIKSACQLVAAIAFAKVARYYARRHHRLGTAVAIAMVLLLGLMIGEELSWGQRIFGWATPSLFTEINAQSETNLHNINTQLAQNVLYFGGWLLLIGLAFWRRSIAHLLEKASKLKLDFLTDWLPPICFVWLFAVGFAFGDPLQAENGIYYSSNLFIVIATAGLLAIKLVSLLRLRLRPSSTTVSAEVRKSQDIFTIQAGISLLCFIAILTGNLLSPNLWLHNTGAPTEYLELFISFGIMVWALIIKSRLVGSKTGNRHSAAGGKSS